MKTGVTASWVSPSGVDNKPQLGNQCDEVPDTALSLEEWPPQISQDSWEKLDTMVVGRSLKDKQEVSRRAQGASILCKCELSEKYSRQDKHSWGMRQMVVRQEVTFSTSHLPISWIPRVVYLALPPSTQLFLPSYSLLCSFIISLMNFGHPQGSIPCWTHWNFSCPL